MTQPAKLSLGKNLLLLAWVLVMQTLAYGLTHGLHEHLRILSMPKHQPWPVSNGDMITATYPVVRLVMPTGTHR